MSEQLMHATRVLMEITNASRQFERMVDAMLVRVRTALGVPAGDPEADPAVEAEFSRLRLALRSFYPEYEQLFRDMYLKHLGLEQLAAIVATLSAPGARAYFRALELMEAEMTERLTALMQRMGETPMQAA